MNHLAGKYRWLEAPQVRRKSAENVSGSDAQTPPTQAYVSLKNEADKVLVFERAGLLFIFNFHPSNSFTDYRVGVEEPGEYKIVLSSDEKKYGGFDNISLDGSFFTTPLEWNGRKNFLQVSTQPIGVLKDFSVVSGIYPNEDVHRTCEVILLHFAPS